MRGHAGLQARPHVSERLVERDTITRYLGFRQRGAPARQESLLESAATGGSKH